MTKIIYNDANHARGRLVDTLVRYKSEPVIIRNARGGEKGMELEGYLTSTGEGVVGDIDTFDLSPVPLGNVVVGDRFSYVTRIPARRWKQGLDRQGMKVLQTPWGSDMPRIESSSMRDSILGKFFKFEEAYDNVQRAKLIAAPFDRNFGLGRNDKGLIVLTHRGSEVGIVEDDIFLFNENFYLQEDLLHVLNKG